MATKITSQELDKSYKEYLKNRKKRIKAILYNPLQQRHRPEGQDLFDWLAEAPPLPKEILEEIQNLR
ncbi:MAG: hypothetical protein LBI17_02385 [Rickettsiales bacterium]|jgi:hypothetical protein|nr:hypothetical protein [Rickettsiales bacterium]